jgi:LmbE family N-acetylglucosaminyl deacetylase
MTHYDRIMIWGAHPDDEIIMGGTIALMSDAGCQIIIVTLSDGAAGFCRPEWADTIANMRKQEAAACDEILGVSERIFLDLPDQGVRHEWRTTRRLIGLLRKYRPQALFTLGPEDRNSDHIAVHQMTDEIVWQASENVLADEGEPYAVPLVYIYHGHANMGPSIEVDVTQVAARKADAWLSQTTQVEMLPRIRERMERLKGVAGGHELATERFVIWHRNVLSDFLPLP